MVCLHGTDPATVYLSAWARVDDMVVADMERALYGDRSLVKHLAMRRTLFVFPRATLRAAQAGASDRVADGERRRLVREVERAGLHANGERWLRQASDQVLGALSDGREATSSELRDVVPSLEGSIVYGEGKSWGGRVAFGPRVLTTLSAAGRIVRASNVGGWTHLATQMGLDGSPGWGQRSSRATNRRAWGPGAGVAACLRSRDRRGHQVVARFDAHGRAARPEDLDAVEVDLRGDRLPAARRSRADRSCRAVGRRSCRRSIRPRWGGSSVTGTSVLTRRSSSTPAATPAPRRGGTAGSSVGGGRTTGARSSFSCWRTSARTAGGLSMPRRPASPRGSAASECCRDSLHRCGRPSPRTEDDATVRAGEGNRTPVSSLGSLRSAIEPHPHLAPLWSGAKSTV